MIDKKKYIIRHICPSFNNPLYTNLVEEQMNLGNNIRVFYFRQRNTGLPNGDKPYVDGATPYNHLDRYIFSIKEKKIYKAYMEKYFDMSVPDFIHAHSLFSAGYIAYKEKKNKGIPYIVAVRGTDVNIFFKKRVFLRSIGRKIMMEASAVVFISNSHKNLVFSNYISNMERRQLIGKTYVIPNGIDDFWHNNYQSRTIENRNKLRLIYYGDIDSNKNIDITIKAIEVLNHKYEVEYTVIGKIKEKKYRGILKNNRFCKHYDFMEKEELIKYLRRSDIFIMPSFSETFGLTYVEAMSQGLPIIYSRGQGFDGQFEEGYVGYHVDPRSINDVCNSIDLIMDNYNTISKHCVLAARNFTWRQIALLYQELYDKVM